jgi:deoxyribose-phosphate aldolase
MKIAPLPAIPMDSVAEPNIAALIDHTLLRPDATASDVRAHCRQALEYRFAAVCVHPYWIPLAARELARQIPVATVAGFPLGANTTAIKAAEAEAAVYAGAEEIDMVLNLGELRGGNHAAVRDDIRAVARVVRPAGAILKVILETALLDDEQKRIACALAEEAGADFVKTSTGFGPRGATMEDVRLMRASVSARVGVKAAGGIRTLQDLLRMAEAGANRIGTSAGVAILKEAAERALWPAR